LPVQLGAATVPIVGFAKEQLALGYVSITLSRLEKISADSKEAVAKRGPSSVCVDNFMELAAIVAITFFESSRISKT
jgi:hypothetical protein